MNNAEFEKIAKQLAVSAVTRDTTELGHIKRAAGFDLNSIGQYINTPAGRYALGGLGGAGIGALVGAMQPKRKGRNALYYGALGGLGGLGLAHLYNSAGGVKETPAVKPQTPATPAVEKPAPAAAAKSPVLSQDTATIDDLSGPPKDNQLALDNAIPRLDPTAVRAEASKLPDLGPNFPDSENMYRDWRINPERLSWSARYLNEKAFRSRAATEELARRRLAQEIADSVKIPFKDRPSLRQIKSKYPAFAAVTPADEVAAEHQRYAPFQTLQPDGTIGYDPKTLELIRQARLYGFGDSPARVREFARQRSDGNSATWLRLRDLIGKAQTATGDAMYRNAPGLFDGNSVLDFTDSPDAPAGL